jgi:hypothetical protein
MQIFNLDTLGLFLFIAGFVIGLGAVVVIDIHGFLGRKSAYWTVATTRAHKVTNPLIWTGTFLAILGGSIFYREESFSGIPLLHSIFALILILNGLFLSFVVSPFLLKKEKEGKDGELLPQSLQNKIIVSFIISALFWWSSLFLLVVYILES